MFCTSCGQQIAPQAEICPKCGVRPFTVNEYCQDCGSKVNTNQAMCIQCGSTLKVAKRKENASKYSPLVMGIVSLFIPGLSQILLGQVTKGCFLLFGAMILGAITFGASAFITYPLTIIDAVMIANKKQRGQEVGEWEFF